MTIKRLIHISIGLGLAVGIFLVINKIVPIDDGWKNCSPDSVGMNAQVLRELKKSMHAADFGTVDGVVIVKDGALVFEEYDNGYNSQKVHEIASVTKSITSLLVGMSIDQGKIDSVDHTLLSYFNDNSIKNLDERKKAITLEDVLTMRSGFSWNEWLPTSPENNPLQKMYHSSSWIKTTLNTRMDYTPGKVFQYNSGSTVLLDYIIKKRTNMNSDQFASKYLFKPLGIKNHFWSKEDFFFFGTANTGGGLNLRPRDLAKIGQLVLNKGKWKGKQVVSEQWVEKILTPHVNYVYLGSMQVQYGYLWYIFPKGTLNKQYAVYGCCGAGGQHLFIIPECNLVFVVVSNNYDYHMQGLGYAAEILNNYVITAFNENKNEK